MSESLETPADPRERERTAAEKAGTDKKPRQRLNHYFESFAATVTRHAGSSKSFGAAAVLIVLWASSGPLFGFSEAWQLIVNTGTTIVTFLMVFLIQQSQNKDSEALHLKLDELICKTRHANRDMLLAEQLDEEELRRLAGRYQELAEHAQRASAGIPASGRESSADHDADDADDDGAGDDEAGGRRQPAHLRRDEPLRRARPAAAALHGDARSS